MTVLTLITHAIDKRDNFVNHFPGQVLIAKDLMEI
jgi:hypothetical protein